jgi:ATP-binding cassette subfamily B protein
MQAFAFSKMLEHLTEKSLGYHSNRMSGGIVSEANKLNGSIERFWDTIIFNAIPIITTLVSISIVLSIIMWQFAIVIITLSIIIIAIMVRTQVAIVPISEEVSKRSSASTAYFADIIGNISAVKAFATEKIELKKHKKIVEDWRQANLQEMKTVVMATGSFGIMMTILNVCAFMGAILAVQNHIFVGSNGIGSVYLMISYTLSIVSQLWSVSRLTRNYMSTIGNASPMINTLREEIEIKDPINPEKLVISRGEINFNKVVFTHSENDQALFNELSLKIKPGEQVGLIGRSGSGKTSLTRLLLRFSDIEGGSITIDGQDITNISQADLRREIAYVAQEPSLFHRSLRENIAYSKPNATDEEIRHAAKQAHALEFIDNLPKGLDTLVGERGVKLSGGQRQRIVIARAILKDAPILLLDEATSALDSESERLIQDALIKLMKGRTSIVIAHRLSTIARLDRIIVLDDGKIIEQGTHKDLLSKNGVYAKLWSHQSGGFIEE